MADGEKNKKSFDPSEERFRYIGFDVFPGKAEKMFKSEDERKSWVEKVLGKLARSQGEVRDRCTLVESRLSGLEKIFLTIAAIALIGGLFIPWFSGYIPVSYTELGSYGDYDFYYASKDDQKGINDLAGALKRRHERIFNRQVSAPAEAMTEEPVEEPVEEAVEEAMPADAESGMEDQEAGMAAEPESEPVTEEAGGEETPDMGDQPPPSQPVESNRPMRVPEEIKIIFVTTPQIEQIHGTDDLNRFVVASFTYNARTGRENLVFGTNNAMRALPGNIIMQAQVNDSIATAVTDSMRAAAVERIEAGDSTLSVDSITYAGPVLVNDKAVPELANKGVVNDNYSVSGIGAVLKLGTYASMIFSSGIVLVITGILMIVYFVSCIILAILNLYLLYAVKVKKEDDYVLYLKKMLKFNWIPVFIWLVMFILSFVGSGYGFDTTGMLSQVGDSYNIASFIGLSSFGIYITLAAFLIVALKGKEI